jgi:hypothetical protein
VRGNLHRPQRCHRGLRRVFYLAARSATKPPDGPSRAFYQRKRTEGKRHVQALIALARRLINLIRALIRDNRTFTTEAPAPAATAARHDHRNSSGEASGRRPPLHHRR